ncbi:MAG: hypothetical protein ACRD34_04525 [Bryobacteraceae bacterium]
MRTGILFAATFLSPALLLLGADRQFSGNWVLEVAQSDFGNAARPTKGVATYTVRGDVVNAIQTSYLGGAPQKNRLTWYLDGLQHPSQQPAPGYSVTHWKNHTLVNERSSNDGLYKQTIRVTLSPDGKTATEIMDTKTPQGSNHEKLVWKKAGSGGG